MEAPFSPPPAESPEEAAGDQESEDDLSASRTSLERQAPHRGNTMVHVCWHRNTSVSMVDFSVAVEVGPGRGRALPSAHARRGCCGTAGVGLSPPPGCLHADGFPLLPQISSLVESVVGQRWSVWFFCVLAPEVGAGPPKPCAGGTLEPPTTRVGCREGVWSGSCGQPGLRQVSFMGEPARSPLLACLGPGSFQNSPNPIL